MPRLATPLPQSKSPRGPLSPLSPTSQALASFRLELSELKGVETNATTGEVEVDGIPRESWDISFTDLVIERELAEGTFGRVYLGQYFGTKVAVKLLFQADMVANIGKYILRELAMLRAVTHPNIVQFLGLCRHRSDVYVVTEYVANGDLMELLHNHDLVPLSWSLRVHLMMEITKPVAYLHSRSIVHRDIKLENVLVGENWSVKLCDFGFARCMDNVDDGVPRDSRIRKMTVAGTDQWMAPEVLLQQPYNENADVFSLGCTFYEVLCRRQPPTRNFANNYAFDVKDFLQDVERSSPKELVMLVLDMCQLKPSKRPSAKQVLARLVRVAASLPVVDLSEASQSIHSIAQSHNAGVHIQATEESSESFLGDDENDEERLKGPLSDPMLLSLQLRRALSADSGSQFMDGPAANSSGNHHRVAEHQASSRLRYEKVTVHEAYALSLNSGWITITSSLHARPRKFFVILVSEGSLFLFRSEKPNQQSSTRIFFEQQSVVTHGESEEILRVQTPVTPNEFWLLDFKSETVAAKWFNSFLGVIMRSDFDYHARLKNGAPFGWSPATRENGTSCFLVQMIAPDETSVVLAISVTYVRLLLPYTEEIIEQWDSKQVSGYALSPGGLLDIELMEVSSAKRFGKAKDSFVRYRFASELEHKEIYEKLEALHAERKARNDQIYNDAIVGNRDSGSNAGGGLNNTRRDGKTRRRSLNLGQPSFFGRSSETLSNSTDAPVVEGSPSPVLKKSPSSPQNAIPRRGRSTTFTGLFKKSGN